MPQTLNKIWGKFKNLETFLFATKHKKHWILEVKEEERKKGGNQREKVGEKQCIQHLRFPKQSLQIYGLYLNQATT